MKRVCVYCINMSSVMLCHDLTTMRPFFEKLLGGVPIHNDRFLGVGELDKRSRRDTKPVGNSTDVPALS